ncbi:nose resistant to fluoxetine protein 6-like [Pectinophora gossypiella]|uniref:nose resistant to fluoxetine protein 6-like n=1 Tax=Pectinophora gossypiella TaxID=13191 RepID=UPI00214E5EC8|nr:nose resistant to fluoxetine protein 6-like [Pectinophora gossypiella]
MKYTVFLCCVLYLRAVQGHVLLDWEKRHPAFDPKLYEEALDPEECQKQLEFLSSNFLLRIQFVESGLRIPRSILMGNLVDMGNYLQCLSINEKVEDMTIEGKYCSVSVPIGNTYNAAFEGYNSFNPNDLQIDNETRTALVELNEIKTQLDFVSGQSEKRRSKVAFETDMDISFSLAVCVPKPCTSREGINGLLFNLSQVDFHFEEKFCRFKDDKPWAPVDYVAIAIFSFLGLLTLLSTSYDLWQTKYLGKDPTTVSTVGRCFSVYTNGRRLTTFVSTPDTLECVDGVRAIAMIWVVIGHGFITFPPVINALDTIDFIKSYKSSWITAAIITVDTFFMLSGMLVVYSTAGKLTGMKLLKNLHMFYLHRLLRMFPLLAALVLIQASIAHRISDGPLWDRIAWETDTCRMYWWNVLLYIQNYVGPMCQGHTWYLAIDMHLHIISPIVLFWVLSKNKNAAWMSLVLGLLASLVASTIFNFINDFPVLSGAAGRTQEESQNYQRRYYINTLTRASPFFVGMIFGYLLHIWRGQKLRISKIFAVSMWTLALTLTTCAMMAQEPARRDGFSNQTYENFTNSFMRPAWALGLGWIIFACVKGYGGPVNWFLSLQMWKLLSRLSYSIYLFHYSILFIIRGSALTPIFFSEAYGIYIFFSQFVLSFVVGFALTLIIDSPFSTIFKLLLSGGPKTSHAPAPREPVQRLGDKHDNNTFKN